MGIYPASKASERGRLHPALPVEGATRAPTIEGLGCIADLRPYVIMQRMKRISITFAVTFGALVATLPIACRSTSDVYTLPDVPPSDREGHPPPSIFSSKGPCPPETEDRLEACFEQAGEFLKKGQSEQARAVLKGIRERYPKTLWAPRASFILGKMALDEQNTEALDFLKQCRCSARRRRWED